MGVRRWFKRVFRNVEEAYTTQDVPIEKDNA